MEWRLAPATTSPLFNNHKPSTDLIYPRNYLILRPEVEVRGTTKSILVSTKIHMAVRGLGCPVWFTLTAGQKGDAPRAAAVIEGLPAEVVMADRPTTQITCAKPSPPRGRSPSIEADSSPKTV